MDPFNGLGNDASFYTWAFSQLQQDYDLVATALNSNDPASLRTLLDRKAYFSDEHLKIIWVKFPNIAVEYLNACPRLAMHCPASFLEQQRDNVPLIVQLFNLGLNITADEYVSFSIRYPKVVSKVLEAHPNLAKLCPPAVFERLEAWPQTERVRKVVEKSGAMIHREDVTDTGINEEVEEVKKSVKKIRVAEDSDEELPSAEGSSNE